MRSSTIAIRRPRARRALLGSALAAAFGIAATAYAATYSITVSATVLSKNSCSFNSDSSAISLPIDPTGRSTVSGTSAIVFRCMGSSSTATYSLSNDSGLHGSSPSALRMQSTTDPSAYLPYTLSYPSGGSTPKNTDTTITVVASVSPSSYQDAPGGTYSDSVVLTISP